MEKNVDKKRFHLIHRMVSMLSQIKGLDAKYDSKDVHKGMFTVSFEGTDYDVLVSKHEESKKPNTYHRCIEITTINTSDYKGSQSGADVTASSNRPAGPTEVKEDKDKCLKDIFNELDEIVIAMFGDI